jgi:hypothetical protein
MKRLAIATVLLAGTAFPASAVEVWQGDMFITAASAACVAEGYTVNDFFRAVYRPRNVEDNGIDTRLSLISARNAHRFLVENAPLTGAGNYHGNKIGSTAAFSSWDSTFSAASVTPPLPTVNTQTVVIKVTFKDFADFPGCTATLQGSLGNRPNL